MTAGVIGGAISGGLTGALRGMALGGVSGAAGLVFSMAGPPGIMVMAGLGLGLSANSDGWEGLLQFGAALVGAYVGSRIGMSIQTAKGNPLKELKSYSNAGNKPHFDHGGPLIGQRMQAQLGPDTSEPLAWGVGGDITAGAGGGALLGGRASVAGGAVYDTGSGGFYRYGTAELDPSSFALGGSAGAGAELSFYTGNIQDFSGASRTLNITFGSVSVSVTPGANNSLFFTLMPPGTGIGSGFEFTGVNSHTIIKPGLFGN